MAGDSDVKLAQSIKATVTQTITSPLPLASEIQGYEEVLPGSADRILTMVEKEVEHRHQLQKRELEIESRNSLLAICAASLITLSILGCLVWLIINGHTEGAAVIAGSALASFITAVFKLRPKDNNQPPNSE